VLVSSVTIELVCAGVVLQVPVGAVVGLKVAGAGVVLGVVRAGVVLQVPVGAVVGLKVVVASLQAEAPATEYLPTGHKRHTASEFAPVVEEYLPATQSVHTVAAGPAETKFNVLLVHAPLHHSCIATIVDASAALLLM
jgi:hypothetical protein